MASPDVLIPAALTPAEYHRRAREIAADPPDGLVPLRVACLSSHSMEFVRPFLVVEGARLGFAVTAYFGPFGQFEQEVADPHSGLHRFRADALVLAMRPEDVDPDAVVRYHATGGQRFAALTDEMVARLAECVRAFRASAAGPVLVANFALPATVPLGPFDAGTPGSLTDAVAAANRRLRDELATFAGSAVWDFAGLVTLAGRSHWTDARLWALGRIAVAARHQPGLAAHLMRSLRALLRPAAKCLVLDLDQTLWGGVIGDDGIEGIRLGDDHPGSAFKQFQRHVLALADRGVLLAVASKNDPDTVAEVFRSHPDMLIRWEDLAAVRVNWEPKSGNLRAIATELNIGADALVFFDDNPVERAEVRANAPEVLVVEVPADPLQYVAALDAAVDFDQPAVSDEDRQRVVMYRQERQRRVLAEGATSPEEFLRTLEMVAQVGLAEPATLGRIAQLVGKTNQFNLTTRRHAHGELARMAEDPDTVVAWLRLADRFGDQGLISVGILCREGERARIDTLLMSCRVMNRQVEHAMVAYLLEQARRLGCVEVIGEYLPTRKNAMVRDLYPQLGFQPVEGADGTFVLDLRGADVAWPDQIRREDVPVAAAR